MRRVSEASASFGLGGSEEEECRSISNPSFSDSCFGLKLGGEWRWKESESEETSTSGWHFAGSTKLKRECFNDGIRGGNVPFGRDEGFGAGVLGSRFGGRFMHCSTTTATAK